MTTESPAPTLPDRLGPFGAALPQVGDDAMVRPDRRTYAADIEALGLRGLWTCELTTCPVLDPLALLAHAAATTEAALLGVAVVLAPLHDPLTLANQLATIDVLSSGRLAVGVGFGSNPAMYPRHGLSPERRLTRYLDAIDLVQQLWSHEVLDYDNGIWSLEGATNVVTPVQRPRPPLFIGARQPAAVERAARLGDGWVVSGSAPPAEVRAGRESISRTLAGLGRDPDTFTVAQRVYLAIDDDEGRGMARMGDWFDAHYGNRAIAERSAVVGSVDRVVDHVGELRAGGVDHVILNPVFDEFDQVAAVVAAAT